MLKNQIKFYREAAGLSKAELSRRTGVCDVTIHYWESGVITSINSNNLLSVANVFGITVSELLEDPLLSDHDANVARKAVAAAIKNRSGQPELLNKDA